jgi:hypothetical protein
METDAGSGGMHKNGAYAGLTRSHTRSQSTQSTESTKAI